MVQTNIAGIGTDTSPSAQVQRQKDLLAMADRIGLVTSEERAARLAADRAAIQGATSGPQEQALTQDINTMNQAEQIAAAFPDEADEKVSPEEIANIMMSPAPSVTINEEEALQEELRLRNRLVPKTEMAAETLGFPGVKTMRGLYDIAVATDAVGPGGGGLISALNRVGKTAALMSDRVGLDVTKANRKVFLETGSWQAAKGAVADPSGIEPQAGIEGGVTFGDIEMPTRPLYKADTTLAVNTTNIIMDVLNAGMLNEKGQIRVDPELFNIMAMNAEQSFIEAMYQTDQEASTPDVVEDMETGEQQLKRYEVKKSQGLERLGKDIYREYKQFQAGTRGLETDSYLRDIDNISPKVFTQLGGMAKDYYYKANSAEADPEKGIIERPRPDKDTKAPVTYVINETGAQHFEEMYRVFSGLFAAKEVKPQPMATKGGEIAGEGGQITRRMTTWMNEDIGDTTMSFEAMANQNTVRMSNDPTRTDISTLLFMLGIGNGGSVESRIDPATLQPLSDRYDSFKEGPNGTNYYADVFKMGGQKFKELQNEKLSLLEKVDQLKADPTVSPYEIAAAQKIADNYRPKTILRLEREKAINIQEAMLRWGDKVNHLTYALQLLTGRMHAQQTLYNPQAHPQIRNVVTGNKKYIWKPGGGSALELIWMEGMAANLFEDPKVIGEVSWKKQKGFRMPTDQRIKEFKDREAKAKENPNEGLWNQYVAWGKELQQLTGTLNKTQAKELLSRIKNARNDQEVQRVKEVIRQSYGSNPMSTPLKVYLADFEQDAIKQADYLIALSKYDEAKKNNKPFVDTQAWEIDGKTHGPLTMGAQFGSVTMLKRGDMIMSVPLPQKIGSDEYKDLRDAMADTMVDDFARIANSSSFKNSRHGNAGPALAYILDQAIADRENFLKKSPMTMGYGQDIMLLRQHVDKAISLSDPIRKTISDNKLSRKQVTDFLHNMLVNSIYQNMEPQAIEAMSTIKSVGWQAVLLNTPIQIEQPTGLYAYAAGMQYTPDEEGSFKWSAKRRSEDKDLLPSDITETTYQGEAQAQAFRYRPSGREIGGWTVSRILASLIQAYDADMATGVFTNSKYVGRNKEGKAEFKTTNYWNDIQKAALANGAEVEIVNDQGIKEKRGDPFVLQIYDAFLVDSGSLDAVRKVSNKIHKEGLINDNAAGKVFKWYHNERENKLKELRADTNSYIMLGQDGFFSDESSYMKVAELFSGAKHELAGSKHKPYKNLTTFLKKNIQEKWNRDGTEVQVFDPDKNKMVTERVNRQTLNDWDKKKFKIAKSMAALIQANLEPTILEMHKTSYLTGADIASIIDELNKFLKLDEKVAKAESEIETGKKEVARWLSQGPSNNIDL